MKITNYKYGFYDAFDCVIHGKITVTQKEWQKITKYLRSYLKRKKDIFSLKIFEKDITLLKGFWYKRSEYYNIRVTLTEKTIDHFGTEEHKAKYKRGNYMFEVLN